LIEAFGRFEALRHDLGVRYRRAGTGRVEYLREQLDAVHDARTWS
jgi:hypothetical protein